VCHVNHGWRGADSDRDAAFVEAYCRSNGLPFLLRSGKTRIRGRSREHAAREARYRALRQAAASLGAAAIATAHTPADAAETLLLALLRGSSLSGLSGIRERRDDGVVRPMLSVPREAVLAFLQARGARFRIDASNSDLTLERNWVRRKLLPLLRKRCGPA